MRNGINLYLFCFRLFKLLVGYERVSAIEVITELLESNVGTCNLPCMPIAVNIEVRNSFKEHSTLNKELLGQALLVVVTFMNLFVYDNSKSWSVILSRNKQKA